MTTMKRSILPLLLASALLTTAAACYTLQWTIGEGYAIKFSTDKVEGAFTDLRGQIAFDENNLDQSSFDVAVAAASIETGIGLKNKHARSETWFNAERYPDITFRSATISKSPTGYETTGTLSLHGVKNPVTIPFTFQDQTFIGQFQLNRLDYKLGPETGLNGTVGKVLTIDLHVPVKR